MIWKTATKKKNVRWKNVNKKKMWDGKLKPRKKCEMEIVTIQMLHYTMTFGQFVV
jgi:hypothetical protein